MGENGWHSDIEEFWGGGGSTLLEISMLSDSSDVGSSFGRWGVFIYSSHLLHSVAKLDCGKTKRSTVIGRYSFEGQMTGRRGGAMRLFLND